MSPRAQDLFSRFFIKPPLVPLLILASFIPGFWSMGNMRILAEAVSVDGIVVIGMTIVMIAGGFDMSVGAVMAMGGVVAVVLLPYGLGVSVVAAGTFGALAGTLSGTLVTRLRINPFISTLAVMVMVRGAVLAYTDTRPVVSLDDMFLALGEGWPVPYAFLIMVAVAITAHVWLNSRPWGRHVYAVGADETAAAMSGLRVGRLKLQCYLISGALAGFAGLLLAARLGTGSPIIGESTPLSAAAAALIGGASLRGGEGSVGGAMVGLLFVGGLVNAMNLLGVASYYQSMVIGGMLFALVVADGAFLRMRSS
ncbi:ABC transporter permease [Rhodobium gokarnense]|uniref:Ribose/xylose/arabinose/galactoside ABC-type transport system permease subunit n=1 Tax=Rhodobium gokarnense TaxID=364296 RepID=A0ABT3HF24_9HYPH|nr:ABC transporter permease [Rhodobium gokarnense]MCW2308975.1 ribose/xylose/arabinose/galactoside ABC-type transport system permease subunit [Rhodobium gokarnense]